MSTERSSNEHPGALHYRGAEVIDPAQRHIGTIDDVVYADGAPAWAVVELGLLRAPHYLPIAAGYLADNGSFVVPYDKHTVKAAPKATRDHSIDRRIEAELIQHYELAS